MTYEVIHIEFKHPSFSWSDGLYAVIERHKHTIDMCKISDKGEAQRYEDGRLMISCTSVDNTGIEKTNLKIEIP